MPLRRYTHTLKFFTAVISDSEADQDQQNAAEYTNDLGATERSALIGELRQLAQKHEMPLEALGAEANRWFASVEEAQEWIKMLLSSMDADSDAPGTVSQVKVLDSNGTELKEDDSVSVIKDLKVKGGSSDLKRGTIIKKIHLIDDPENIECRVNGSTLVLKTMFLKKC
jgi:protein PhnA